MKVEILNRHRPLYGPVTVLYAERGGRPVLRGQRAWTKVSGLLLNCRRLNRSVIVMLRRHA